MRKICFAMLMLLVLIAETKADDVANYLRVECNQDLGFLLIEDKNVLGKKISESLTQTSGVYTYDLNPFYAQNQTEVMLINNIKRQEPFFYSCAIADNHFIEVKISWKNSQKCVNGSSRNYYISIFEKEDDFDINRKIVDEVEFGCAAMKKLLVNASYDSGADNQDVAKYDIDLEFNSGRKDVLYSSDDLYAAVTDKRIDKSWQENLKYRE